MYEKLLPRISPDSLEELQTVYVNIATVIEQMQTERVRVEAESRLNQHIKYLQQEQKAKARQQPTTEVPSIFSLNDSQREKLENEIREQIRNEQSLKDPRLDEVYGKIVELSDRVIPPVSTYSNFIRRLNRQRIVRPEDEYDVRHL